MEVIWLRFAENKLSDIYDYYVTKAGKKVAQKIVPDIINKTIDLEKNKRIGQIEELLKGREQEFRYLVSSHHKIIYWVNHNKKRVEIVNVFDTRQNPVELVKTTNT